MKPKVSTGYLTPQATRKKNVAKARLSDTEENPSEPGIDANMFTALMKCPEKKKMILELLAANKNAIEKYKKNEAKSSPLGKVKNKKRACESPTALFRRRALEQMTGSPSSTNRSNSSRSELSRPSSRYSESSTERSESPIAFDKILDGVVAYVEIKNKDQDRSSGAKAILKSMGAELREKFTNDVTHVIFKDGSFMTYQKAKLMKIHLVSILWVEFCRKTMKKQPEKQYPALKSGFQDNETSMVCSQMQKEYEDIIRDEYRKSIMHGTPLPSTRSFIDRRRTLMTPSVSNLNSSTSSFQTADEGTSSQELSNREVAAINGFIPETEVVDNESLILNDPQCFSEVSGPMVNGSTVEKRGKRNSISNCILRSVENVDANSVELTKINTSKSTRSDKKKQESGSDSDMEITMILDPSKTPKASKSDIYKEKTPKLPAPKISATVLFDRRKTICHSLLSSDTSTTSLISSDKSHNVSSLMSSTSTTSLISSDKSHNVSSLMSSDKSTNISGNPSFAVPKPFKKSKRSSSSLFGSNESFIFGKNKATSSKISKTELDKTASAMSELNLLSDKDTSKKSSVMSSLQISSEKKATQRDRRSSSVSKLWISSEQKLTEKCSSMSDLRLLSEKSNKNKEHFAVSGLNLSSDKDTSKKSSVMSSLQISSEKKESERARRSSSMSRLCISSEQKPTEKSVSMSDLRLSSEKSNKNKEHSAVSGLNLSSDKGTSKKSSVMSNLQISSEKLESKKSKSSNRMSRLRGSSQHTTADKTPEKSISLSQLRLSSEKSRNNKKLSSAAVDKSSMSSLQISSESNKKLADKSSMSSLQVSTESRRSSSVKSSDKNNKDITINSDPSLMSSLHVSSERASNKSARQSKEIPSNNASFSSLDSSNSARTKNLVENVIDKLKTPDSRKSYQSFASAERSSINSDDSEILVPRRKLRKTGTMRNIGERNDLEDSSESSGDNLSKSRELELLCSVTKRRNTLGPRRSNTGRKTPQKDLLMNENKVLIVNVVKSLLNNNLQDDRDSSESKDSASLIRRSRRTLGRELKNNDLSKTPEKNSRIRSGKKTIQNEKSKNVKSQIHTENKGFDNRLKMSSNTSASESDIDHSSNSKSKSDYDSGDSRRSRTKQRKLYNPDDSIHVLVDDEEEREQKRLEARKRKSEGVFINPAELLKSSDNRRKSVVITESVNSESSEEAETPPKRPKKGNKKDLDRVSLNSSADEQKELLNEIIGKNNNNNEVPPKTPNSLTKNNSKSNSKTPKVRTPADIPTRRKSMRIIKPTQKVIDSQKNNLKSAVPNTPQNRRSTLDFQPVSSIKKPKKVDKTKLPTIVCTKLHKSDVQVFSQIVKKLGRFTLEDEVSSRTTHLVAGEPKRTINMLRAISRGCWVLKLEWVLQSLEAGKWLREEDFEIHDFSPAVQKCRLERQAFGPTYTLDVFESCPPIYIAPGTSPRCSDLKELITTCRGKVVTVPRMAKVIIGEYIKQEDTVCVNETWALDCITFNKKISFKKQYLLEKNMDGKRKSLVV